MRIAVISSTSGSVMAALLGLPYFRERLSHIVSDRLCKAIEVGRRNGVETQVFPSAGGADFCDALAAFFGCRQVDLFISFYTRLFRGRFLEGYSGRLVNLHPSILPACPGMDGFGDTLRSGAMFVGSTIHFVDAGVDTGPPIIQAAAPCDRSLPIEVLRHKVFVQQCKSLLQVINWFEEDRIVHEGRQVKVLGARYDIGEFSPNLDFDLANGFDAPAGAGGHPGRGSDPQAGAL